MPPAPCNYQQVTSGFAPRRKSNHGRRTADVFISNESGTSDVVDDPDGTNRKQLTTCRLNTTPVPSDGPTSYLPVAKRRQKYWRMNSHGSNAETDKWFGRWSAAISPDSNGGLQRTGTDQGTLWKVSIEGGTPSN
jgi:hypothetical protein